MSDDRDDDRDEGFLWRIVSKWIFVAVISLGLFLLTFSPLLAGMIP